MMPGKYKCSECVKDFRTKFQLKLHSYQHTGEKLFKCDLCTKSFTTRSKLKSHKKTHDGYPCKLGCNFVAHKWTHLQNHIKNEHKPKCETCDKVFSSNYNLKSHKQTHLDKANREKYVCSFDGCKCSYSKKSNLKMHIKRAHEEVNFVCPIEGCGKKLKHKCSLNKHISWHSKPKEEKEERKVK